MGEMGLVEAKLLEYGDLKGLVFGAFGEASDATNMLLQQIREARLRFQGEEKDRRKNSGF